MLKKIFFIGILLSFFSFPVLVFGAEILSNPAYDAYMGGVYGASKDHGETDDPLTDPVTYTGAVYYVDCTGGNDANDGLSPANAWQTLTKVNQKTSVGYWDTVAPNANTVPTFHTPWTSILSNSAILFKRGCTYDGYIKYHAYIDIGIFSEYVTFGAYGDRALPRPIINNPSGSVPS